ncbi:uncharacterized protein LOC126881490 [Diabrotica virgifera virgifera]|uniref:Uncharacterized protein n=1 Tax=Diabrotica virgifera virgifera TaxID=50390 RepID=A0ABM5JUW6_DIAVI|nr:uncharacterized protein LOC126881490 [Diabrotica virgifera virgifera]
MELVKHILVYNKNSEIVLGPKFATVNKNSCLLGFKGNLPVLSSETFINEVINKPMKIKVELGTSSEKFIMFNGKKLMILADLPEGLLKMPPASNTPHNSNLGKPLSIEHKLSNNLINNTSTPSTSSNSIPKMITVNAPESPSIGKHLLADSKLPKVIKIGAAETQNIGKKLLKTDPKLAGVLLQRNTVCTTSNNSMPKLIKINALQTSNIEHSTTDSKLSKDLVKTISISGKGNSILRKIKLSPSDVTSVDTNILTDSKLSRSLLKNSTSNSSVPKMIKVSKPLLKPVGEDCKQSPKIMNLSIKVDKDVMSQISNKPPINENKLIKINVASITGSSKADTTDNNIICAADKIKMFAKPITVRNKVMCIPINQDSVESVALDLTKHCESQTVKTPAKMFRDQGTQVDIDIKPPKPETVSIETNTDITGDIVKKEENWFNLLDFSSLDNDIPQSPFPEGLLNSLENFDLPGKSMDNSKEYTTLTNAVTGKNVANYSDNSVNTAKNLFMELRQALVNNDEGNLPIHVGVIANNFKLVKRNLFLLKVLKHSVDVPNSHDYTPLQLALIHNSSIEIIEALLAEGASCRTTDSEGNSILHYGAELNRKEALKLLVSFAGLQRCTLNPFNHEGLTPLMVCCLNKNFECAEILLDADADPNIKDQISGRTALFHAAEKHDVEMVEMLLQFNANTKLKNFFGTSPHDAMYELDGMPEAIKYMILGKNNKRKSLDDNPKVSKHSRPNNGVQPTLKTYSRSQQIRGNHVSKTYTTVK